MKWRRDFNRWAEEDWTTGAEQPMTGWIIYSRGETSRRGRWVRWKHLIKRAAAAGTSGGGEKIRSPKNSRHFFGQLRNNRKLCFIRRAQEVNTEMQNACCLGLIEACL